MDLHMFPIIPCMQPDGLAGNPMAESAKGWHNIQLGVMGFIGLCGVLTMGETPSGPQWLELWSAATAGLAFVVSLLSTWMVGSVAFPLYGFTNPGEAMPASAPGRLRGGIVMTFLSIVLMVLSSLSGWWPSGLGGEKVQVKGTTGAAACGTWVEGAHAGAIWLQTAEGTIKIEIGAISEMSPVSSC
jgi:hypothetical protein